MLLLTLSKGAGKRGKGAGKGEFPEHWIFFLPARRNSLEENATKAVPLLATVHEMGWLQPVTVITTDNSVARSILNGTAKQKCSKASDMLFRWLQDRIKDSQFIIQWKAGLQL